MWTVEGQPWMYTVQLVRWLRSTSIPLTSPGISRSTWPSWSAKPHTGITGSFGILAGEEGPSVESVIGPSIASMGVSGAAFCLAENENFFGGASSSLRCAKVVNKDCKCCKVQREYINSGLNYSASITTSKSIHSIKTYNWQKQITTNYTLLCTSLSNISAT